MATSSRQQLTPAHNLNRMNVSSNRTATPRIKQRILVAVDFGTTNSAIAWVRPRIGGTNTQQPPKINIIQTWPGAIGNDKVPTLLQYENEYTSSKHEQGPPKWGFEAEDGERYAWFKLEQDPNYSEQELLSKYPASTIPPRNKAHVEDLITDYLRLLREHAENVIKDSFKLDIGGGNLFRHMEWEYIITVPAMWPESAQNITERCAEKAGMANSRPVKIIAEPEAAGIYALDQMCQQMQLAKGDKFIICDAGGGTVDLMSYTIAELDPIAILDEAAAGTGGLCGSSFLDRRFDTWLSNHFADFEQWTDGHQAYAIKEFEKEFKRKFTGESESYQFPALGIPDNRAKGVHRFNLKIKRTELLEKVFEPVINDIVIMIRRQLAATPKPVKAVLMAGGFGRNEYLMRKIQEEVGSRIVVERIQNGTTAIVRGALLRALADRDDPTIGRPTIGVRRRVATRHWGIQALAIYNKDIHKDPSQPILSAGAGGEKRIDTMYWFIKKHALIGDGEARHFDLYYEVPVKGTRTRLRVEQLNIFGCELETPPDYPEGDSIVTTKYKRLGVLKADLNKIPNPHLTLVKSDIDGQEFYMIWLKIEMIRHLAKITFKMVYEEKGVGEDGNERVLQRMPCGDCSIQWDTK